MTESYYTEIESVESTKPVAGMDYSDDPLVARVQMAMQDIGEAEAKRKAEEVVLNDLIQSKIVQESDPFIAMMNAMMIVIPQLMKVKEELLVEKTADFDYVSSLNAYMAEAQTNFAYSGDKGESTNQGGYITGNTSYTDETGRVHGYDAAKAYQDSLSTIRTEKLLGGLPADVQGIMNESIVTSLNLIAYTPNTNEWNGSLDMREYTLPEVLWAGNNSPEWTFEGRETSTYTNKNYGYTTGDENLFAGHNRTAASYVGEQISPVFDDAVTQNNIMQNTFNGYAKQVEAGYKFEMENYNSIVNTDAQMYQSMIGQNNAHSKRLRAL